MDTVVEGGFCVGCGACASLPGSPLVMRMNQHGQYVPELPEGHVDPVDGFDAGLVCPFYAADADETTIGRALYPEAEEDPDVGRYLQVLAGHVVEETHRAEGSSGGLTTWVLKRLLELDLVDGIVHVAPGDRQLFEFRVSHEVAEVVAGSKSRYYPIEMSQVLEFIREKPGRYAFVGVPCFVKALRLLALRDPQFAATLTFAIAIFCGHLKSTGYAEMLGWQLGVAPGQLRAVDFRVKLPERPASHYGVSATATDGSHYVLPVHDLYGTNWGDGLFKPMACDYCDDIAGETADISLGDAWLPQYVHDSSGTNIVVVRHPLLMRILAEGASSNSVHLEPLDTRAVYRSQAGNYRHRRDGLSYRLWLCDEAGIWHPPKRVPARRDHLSPKRRRIYELRSRLSHKSHSAFAEAKSGGSFESFVRALAPLVREHRRLYDPLWRRAARAIKRSLPQWMVGR